MDPDLLYTLEKSIKDLPIVLESSQIDPDLLYSLEKIIKDLPRVLRELSNRA